MIAGLEKIFKKNFVREKPFDKYYKEIAEKIGIKPIKKGYLKDWIKVNGLKYRIPGSNEIYRIPEPNEEDVRNSIGKYWVNNGVIVFVNEKGERWVSDSNLYKINLLKKHGYIRNVIWVPFSNGELPLDKKIRKKLLRRLIVRGRQIYEKERKREIEEIYKKIAKERGIKPLEEIEEIKNGKVGFLIADGLYERVGNEIVKIEDRFDPVEFDERRKKVGFYTINNGIIAAINEKGELLVAPYEKKVVEILEKAGYKNSLTVYVPFSNGSTADKVTAKKLELLEKILKRNSNLY